MLFDRKEQTFLVHARHKNSVPHERRFTDHVQAKEWHDALLSHGDYTEVELSMVLETFNTDPNNL